MSAESVGSAARGGTAGRPARAGTKLEPALRSDFEAFVAEYADNFVFYRFMAARQRTVGALFLQRNLRYDPPLRRWRQQGLPPPRPPQRTYRTLEREQRRRELSDARRHDPEWSVDDLLEEVTARAKQSAKQSAKGAQAGDEAEQASSAAESAETNHIAAGGTKVTVTATAAAGSGAAASAAAAASSKSAKSAASPKTARIRFKRLPTRVFLQFFYGPRASLQQIEEQSEFRCPFCLTHGRNILRLLLHLSLCHDRYQYSYLRGEQSGEHHVIIRPLNPQELSMPATTGKRAAATPPADAKRASKGTAATAPAPGTGASAASSSAASSSSGSRRPSLQDALLSASPDVNFMMRASLRKRPVKMLSDYLDDADTQPAKRLRMLRSATPASSSSSSSSSSRSFFHSVTCMPDERERRGAPRDSDSEDDLDMTWLHESIDALFDEFQDVNMGEKAVMRLWSRFMTEKSLDKASLLTQAHFLAVAEEFVRLCTPYLRSAGLRNNFALHLAALADFRILQPKDMARLLQLLNKGHSADHAPPSRSKKHAASSASSSKP